MAESKKLGALLRTRHESCGACNFYDYERPMIRDLWFQGVIDGLFAAHHMNAHDCAHAIRDLLMAHRDGTAPG